MVGDTGTGIEVVITNVYSRDISVLSGKRSARQTRHVALCSYVKVEEKTPPEVRIIFVWNDSLQSLL